MSVTDPDPRIERILREVDAKVNRPIVGLNGEPLLEPLVRDERITYAKDGESYSISPEELLMKAARMQRDGWSLANIRAELDLKGDISDRTLQSALNVGHVILARAIAEGRVPVESVNVLGYLPAAPDLATDPVTLAADAATEQHDVTLRLVGPDKHDLVKRPRP